MPLPSSKLTSSMILGASVVIAAWLISQPIKDIAARERIVKVKGLAEQVVKSDLAVLPVSIEVVANTLDALEQKFNQDREKVIQFFLKRGIKRSEISFAIPVIDDKYKWNDKPPKYRYTGTLPITVRTPNVDLMKTIMQNAYLLLKQGVTLGGKDGYGSPKPTFIFTKLNDIKPSMIKEATINARKAAEQFAKDSNSKVGAIQSATQGFFQIQKTNSTALEYKNVRVITHVHYNLEN